MKPTEIELRRIVTSARARLRALDGAKMRVAVGLTVVVFVVATALARTSSSMWANVPAASVVTACGVVFMTALARTNEREWTGKRKSWGKGVDAFSASTAPTTVSERVNEMTRSTPEVWGAWKPLREKIISAYVTSLWYESITDDVEVPNALRSVLDGAFATLSKQAKEMDLVSLILRELPDILSQTLEAFRSARGEIGEEEFRKMTPEDAEDVLKCVLRKQGELHPAVSGEIDTQRALRALGNVMSEALLDEVFVSPLISPLVRELLVVSLLRPLYGFAKPHWANRGVLFLTGTSVEYDADEGELAEEKKVDTIDEDNAAPDRVRTSMIAHSRSTSESGDATFLYSDFKISARVTGAEIVGSGSSSYAVYLVTVNTNENESWVVPRRFRNFETLHRRLRDVDRVAVNALEFPRKTWIKTSLSAAFMESRRKALDAYLRAVLANKKLAECSELFSFMDARAGIYDPEQQSAPELMKTMSEAMEGVAMMISSSTSDLVDIDADGPVGESTIAPEKNTSDEAQKLTTVAKKPPKHTLMSSMYENTAQTELSDSYETDVWTESPSKFKENGEVKEEDEERDSFVAEIESCMNGPVLDLFECVFTLRSKPMMRRALVSLVRQTIEFFFSIERSISQRIRDFRSAQSMATALSWLLRVVWPEVPYPPDTPKRLAREAETARRALFDVFTNQNVQTVMGTRASARAAHDAFSLIQSPTCCQHVGFVLIETIVSVLFPEITARALRHAQGEITEN